MVVLVVVVVLVIGVDDLVVMVTIKLFSDRRIVVRCGYAAHWCGRGARASPYLSSHIFSVA